MKTILLTSMLCLPIGVAPAFAQAPATPGCAGPSQPAPAAKTASAEANGLGSRNASGEANELSSRNASGEANELGSRNASGETNELGARNASGEANELGSRNASAPTGKESMTVACR